jgi:hypothetical protein
VTENARDFEDLAGLAKVSRPGGHEPSPTCQHRLHGRMRRFCGAHNRDGDPHHTQFSSGVFPVQHQRADGAAGAYRAFIACLSATMAAHLRSGLPARAFSVE